MKHSTFSLAYGCYKAKINLNLIGGPGNGKSSIIRKIGKVDGDKHVITKALSQCDVTDFTGVAAFSDELGPLYDRQGKIKLDKDGKPVQHRQLNFFPVSFIRECLEHPDGILFLDEINRGAGPIQSAALSLILEGISGDTRIPETIWRCSAMNEADFGCNAFSSAAANRFCHLRHKLSPEEFSKGIVNGFDEYELPTINNDEEVKKAKIKYMNYVGQFIIDNPDLLDTDKPDEYLDNTNDYAYPTPRSWEMVVRVLTYLDQNDKDYLSELICGCVGKNAGSTFMRYMNEKKIDFVDLTEFVGKEDKFTFKDYDRPDEVYHVYENLQYWFKEDPKKFFPLWKRIIILLHNNKNKYFKKSNYDNFIRIKWTDNMVSIIKNIFDKKNIQNEFDGLRKELDGAYEMFGVNM